MTLYVYNWTGFVDIVAQVMYNRYRQAGYLSKKGWISAMDDNNEKNRNITEESKKDNNPLSVRVDPYYKEKFEELIKQKGIPKKALIEAMISSYIETEREGERESNISFANEINLLAGNFNEIMNVFKAMAAKSQDTIGTQKSFYEQKLKNQDVTIQMLENSSISLEKKVKELELENNSNKSYREKLEKTIHDLDTAGASNEKDVAVYVKKNADLLEKLSILQNQERDNVILKTEIEKAKVETKAMKSSLEDVTYENKKLLKKISDMNESITEMKNKKADELKEFEAVIRKQAEVDKKLEVLKVQLQYNELQAENLKNLRTINKQAEEITQLRVRLEKVQ